ncbi:hypothetical protein [Variovorax rhizosphaerae]|uniref:Uncharacterized protein n=1 Tax=Variovorax rhizosphaerae TaxID=1836200 RepID=A0ABU8WYC6_9BURK
MLIPFGALAIARLLDVGGVHFGALNPSGRIRSGGPIVQAYEPIGGAAPNRPSRRKATGELARRLAQVAELFRMTSLAAPALETKIAPTNRSALTAIT